MAFKHYNVSTNTISTLGAVAALPLPLPPTTYRNHHLCDYHYRHSVLLFDKKSHLGSGPRSICFNKIHGCASSGLNEHTSRYTNQRSCGACGACGANPPPPRLRGFHTDIFAPLHSCFKPKLTSLGSQSPPILPHTSFPILESRTALISSCGTASRKNRDAGNWKLLRIASPNTHVFGC